jgi:hypothetical protein
MVYSGRAGLARRKHSCSLQMTLNIHVCATCPVHVLQQLNYSPSAIGMRVHHDQLVM